MATKNTRYAKITVVLLILSLIFVQNSCAFGAQSETDQTTITKTFSDLMSSHWAYQSIQTLVSLGGINGYSDGTFRPGGTITYAELCSILLGATGNDNKVSDGNWAKGILQKAYDAKIIDSKTVPLTDAGKAVTRDKMAMILSNSAEELGDEKLTTFADIAEYIRDWNSISSTYQEYVNQCVAAGLIQGDSSNRFKASKNLTRAEAATISERLINKKTRVTPTKFSDEFTEAEKQAATAQKLIDNGAEITRYITAQQFLDEFGVTVKGVEVKDDYLYILLEKGTGSIGVVVNSEYVGATDNYLKNMIDNCYELKGNYIPKYCTGLTVSDPGTGGYLVVVGNPFAILGIK